MFPAAARGRGASLEGPPGPPDGLAAANGPEPPVGGQVLPRAGVAPDRGEGKGM